MLSITHSEGSDKGIHNGLFALRALTEDIKTLA
jgi:hypothetical protein